MEIKTVFLNVVYDVVIHMEQPEGFVQKGHVYLVCKLKKFLYELTQSI